MAGVTSPSLIGSSGVVPLTIIGTLSDICRHMSNCIVRAQNEVFLATNYWIHSNSSTIITDALRELSARAEQRGSRVVVKLMYDRGSLGQVSLSMLPLEMASCCLTIPAYYQSSTCWSQGVYRPESDVAPTRGHPQH